MSEEVIIEHSLKSLKRAWNLQCCDSNKISDTLNQVLPGPCTGTKYHFILISNERATAYMNIHLFRCKHCDVIKFNQFSLIFARFLTIFSFDFENFRPS